MADFFEIAYSGNAGPDFYERFAGVPPDEVLIASRSPPPSAPRSGLRVRP